MDASDRADWLSGARPELLALARGTDRVSPFRVWSALEPEERSTAVRAALAPTDDLGPGLREDVLDALASTFNFRRQTLASWPIDRVADHYGANLRTRDPGLLSRLLRALHVVHRRDLLRGFLDELGVEHDDGLVRDERSTDAYDAEVVAEAADRLAATSEADRSLTYFVTLVALDDPAAPGLVSWLSSTLPAEAPEGPPVDDEETDVDEEEPSSAPVDIEETEEFTTVDRIFVRAVADVGQGIEGSLSEDQLEDAIQELVALNSSRHRSFFHLGFMDAELGRDARGELPAQNADRLRWYWAGYVTGLARKERHGDIVSLYDGHPPVRELGQGGSGSSHVAARLVFEALCRSDRPGEAARFLEVDTVVANPVLFGSLRREGRELLHTDRPGEARGMYELLGRVMDRLEELGVDVRRRTLLEIRRRRAHCFRQLGESARARELLERLLEEERDPGIRAMVHADLGLIDGDFTRLADLRIPGEEDRLASFRSRLERGEDRFRAAAEAEARYSAHGRFCLGVLCLLRGDYADAVAHLDPALSVFEGQPDRYRHGGLLDRARVLLGVAIALSLDAGRAERAAELIRRGISGQSRIPRHFLEDVLEALEMRAPTLATRVAEAVLEGAGGEVLDLVGDSDVARRSDAIADALLQRALEPDRGDTERAVDLRRALPVLLARERHEEAARVLDRLEELARRGSGLEAFLEILEDPRRHEPAWNLEDALWSRVVCLEAAGRYDEAAVELEKRFHRVLSEGGYGAVQEAEGILERVGTYGFDEEESPVGALGPRLEAQRQATAPAVEEEPSPRSVRILFVGGDERQEAHVPRVEEELAESHPQISVTFQHPGWGSNWSKSLDDAVREAGSHDGVVIMRFIRTEFGRRLRDSLGSTPWCACTAAGIRSMKASIVEAARLARRHLRHQEQQAVSGEVEG